jgi:hypothetical protein
LKSRVQHLSGAPPQPSSSGDRTSAGSVGATADLIVVDGDPLADVTVLSRPAETLRLVVTAGRVRMDALARA